MTFFEPRDAAANKPGTGPTTEIGLGAEGEPSLDWWGEVHGEEAEVGVR